MRVLSIDFDYFLKVSEEQVRNFPEQIERKPKESEQAWKEAYKKSPDLKSVELNRQELDYLFELLKKQNGDIPTMVSYSHADIMDLMCDDDRYYEEDLYITHIDMHHDLFRGHDAESDNPILDCGNWVTFVEADKNEQGLKCGILWVCNEISPDIFGFKGTELDDAVPKSIGFVNENMSQKPYDMVFLCRSDTWFPPHLDRFFKETLDLMREHFKNIHIDERVLTERTVYPLRKSKTKHDFERD